MCQRAGLGVPFSPCASCRPRGFLLSCSWNVCVGFFVVLFGWFVALASPELAMKNNLPLNSQRFVCFLNWIFLGLVCFVSEKWSHSPDQPQTHWVAQDDWTMGPLACTSTWSECLCDVVCYCWVLVLGSKSRGLYIVGKHCTPSPLGVFVLFDNLLM